MSNKHKFEVNNWQRPLTRLARHVEVLLCLSRLNRRTFDLQKPGVGFKRPLRAGTTRADSAVSGSKDSERVGHEATVRPRVT